MSVRRVCLDDDEPAYTSGPEEPETWDDELEDEAFDLALEREADWEDAEGKRELALEDRKREEERLEQRPRDLPPVPVDSRRRPPERLTEEQVNACDSGAITAFANLIDAAANEEYGLGVAIDSAARKTFTDQRQSEAPYRWLRQHEPLITPEGVEAELRECAEEHGLGLEDLSRAFRQGGGRPSAAHIAHRAVVRSVLATPFEDDRSRTLMAEVLGCSRDSLYRLMGQPS